MILDTLRAASREAHERLDGVMDLTSPGLDAARYQGYLARFYGMFAPMEARFLASEALTAWVTDYPERLRAPKLVHDLTALGLTDADLKAIPHCTLPPLETVGQQIGMLYVMEGSTLGGQGIARHLQEYFGWDDPSQAAFFYGHGKETMPRWRAFCQMLTAFAEAHPEAEQDVVSSALATFSLVETWLPGKPEAAHSF